MAGYSIEPIKYVKGNEFLLFARNLSDKYGGKNIGYCYKDRTRYCKNYFEISSL